MAHKSKFLGVTKTSVTGSKSHMADAIKNPWQAALNINGKTVYLGNHPIKVKTFMDCKNTILQN